MIINNVKWFVFIAQFFITCIVWDVCMHSYCIKYALLQYGFSLTHTFLNKDRIVGSVIIQEYMGQRKSVFWRIVCSGCAYTCFKLGMHSTYQWSKYKTENTILLGRLVQKNCKVKQIIYDMTKFISSFRVPFPLPRITAYNIY